MAKFTVLQLIHRRDSSALLRCTVLVSVRCVQVVNAFLLSLRSEQNLQAAEHVYVFPSYLAVLWDRQIFNQWMLSSVRSFTLRLTMAYFTICYCVRSLMIPYQFQPQITGSSVADSHKDVPLVILAYCCPFLGRNLPNTPILGGVNRRLHDKLAKSGQFHIVS